MAIKKSILISIFVHAAFFSLFFSNHSLFYNRANRCTEFMSITLRAIPARETKSHCDVKIIDNNRPTPKQKEVKLDEQTTDVSRSGIGMDRINYTEKGGSTDFENYYFMVRKRIIKHMRYPKKSRINNEEGRIKVAFNIDNKGRLLNLSILKKCGFESLNNDATKTITRAAPFAPFPPSIKEKNLQLSIPLKYELR